MAGKEQQASSAPELQLMVSAKKKNNNNNNTWCAARENCNWYQGWETGNGCYRGSTAAGKKCVLKNYDNLVEHKQSMVALVVYRAKWGRTHTSRTRF